MIDKLEATEKPAKLGLQLAAELINELKSVCEGVHIMTVGKEHIIPELMQMAGYKPTYIEDEISIF